MEKITQEENPIPQVRGELFGYTIREANYEDHGKQYERKLVDLYSEDDGHWHLITTFDTVWINDLTNLFKWAEKGYKIGPEVIKHKEYEYGMCAGKICDTCNECKYCTELCKTKSKENNNQDNKTNVDTVEKL